MLHILRAYQSPVSEQGLFKIRRVRPGQIFEKPTPDSTFGSFSILDHATLEIGTVIPLHEHRNDEILSYVWRGVIVHEDSTGQRVELSPRHLMMMNAGRSFFHEESTPTIQVEMLQIFFRPEATDLEPRVQFYDRPESFTDGRWHLIAGTEASDAPLTIRQRAMVFDVHPKAGTTLEVPTVTGMQPWLYMMNGAITAREVTLRKGDALTAVELPLPRLQVQRDATLVAFLVDLASPVSLAGTISGLGAMSNPRI